MLGYILSSVSVMWCSYAASSIFASVLQLSHQRFLVAYPVGLLYVAASSFSLSGSLTDDDVRSQIYRFQSLHL
jgi:hypothetical protein